MVETYYHRDDISKGSKLYEWTPEMAGAKEEGPGKKQLQRDAVTFREAGKKQGRDNSSPDPPGFW